MHSYTMKTMRNFTVNYPLFSYGWGTNEIWVQGVEDNVSVYFFEHPIVALEQQHCETQVLGEKSSISMILDMGEYLQPAKMDLSLASPFVQYNNPRIKKDLIHSQKLKAFHSIKVVDPTSKAVCDGYLLQFKDEIQIFSERSQIVIFSLKRSFLKYNLIHMKSSKSIIFWEYKGDKIQALKYPFDSQRDRSLLNIYEAYDAIYDCKLTTINKKEYLACIDQAFYIKILKLTTADFSNNIMIKIEADYFADAILKQENTRDDLKSFHFVNGMLYTNKRGVLLQKKGAEREQLFGDLVYQDILIDDNYPQFPK